MTSSPLDSLRAGAAALKQQQFDQAAKHLADYCNAHVGVESNEHFQAQIWLVQSYKAMGLIPEARHLCWILSQANHPKIQAWAAEMMTQLPVQIPGRAPVVAPSPTAFGPAGNGHSPSNGRPNGAAGYGAAGYGTGNDAGGSAWGAQNRAAPGGDPSQPSNTGQTGQTGSHSQRPSRAPAGGVSLAMGGVTSNLTGASGLTLLALVALVQALACGLVFLSGSATAVGLAIATTATLLFILVAGLTSPLIMDWVQRGVYGTQWTSLAEIECLSPETAQVLKQVCAKYKLKPPRLGIIEDHNPTAFTYGAWPNQGRLVVSRGLFTYLDDDEVATVYAHELGHMVHGDLAIMTLAATLIQMLYLAYRHINRLVNQLINRLGDRLGSSTLAQGLRIALQTAEIAAWGGYSLGESLLLYLSRTREYYADHFAAEVTGNPNALSRALVKIASGIVEAGQTSQNTSQNTSPKTDQAASPLLQGMRTLGIVDARSVGTVGTAYRVVEARDRLGQVFLWDLFNPWSRWVELRSSHPLMGKRVRALHGYAEQLELKGEFELARWLRAGHQLDPKRLRRRFGQDVVWMASPLLGALVGGGLGLLLGAIAPALASSGQGMLCGGLLGFGLGHLIHALVMYPPLKQPAQTDILTLISDAYASPLRGQPVELSGSLMGRGDGGDRPSEALQFQDPQGRVDLNYCSRWGPLGSFFLGWRQAGKFIDQPARVTGWFRRGLAASVDMGVLESDRQGTAKGYPRFGKLLLAGGCLVAALVVAVLGAGG